jgi:hypothetical protein
MAVATALAKVTAQQISLTFTDDGGGGVDTVANADLIAALTASGIASGPMWDLLHTDHNPNSQAIQRALLLGDASGWPADHDLRDVQHAVIEIAAQSASDFLIDADVDAVTATRGELNITGPAAAGATLVTIKASHTLNR